MSYKRLTPCLFINEGKAVKWFDDNEIMSEDPVILAKMYCDRGADELIVFDLSNGDDEHEEALNIMKRINKVISIPMIAGGNIRRQEDVQKILYTGARRAILNFSKHLSIELIEDVSNRFGKDRIAVSLNDFDTLFKQQHLIEDFSSEIIFMHRLDLNSVINITEDKCIVLTDTMDQNEILKILKSDGVKGVSGLFISQKDMGFNDFKELCIANGIGMNSFDVEISFDDFNLNNEGLLPVVVQDVKTNEVLMLEYMNEEAFEHTVKTGKMTFYDRNKKCLWIKGEISQNYQYVKSLVADCDKDTLLAKVNQVGAACQTGKKSCFFNHVAGTESDCRNPLQIFKNVYDVIADRRENPKEGSYTNYLLDKGMDMILKKIGEESTSIIISAKNQNNEDTKNEISDFLYHTMVLMVEKGITWEDITRELADRS